MVTVHEYAWPDGAEAAVARIRHFAGQGKPLLLGETFAMDRADHDTFLLRARRWLDGSLSFYDGRAPHEVVPTSVEDALYRQSLISYLGLRVSLSASPRLPASR